MASLPARVLRVAVQSSSRLFRDTLSSSLSVRLDVIVVGTVAEPDRMPALCELRQPDAVIFDAGPRLYETCRPVSSLVQRFPELPGTQRHRGLPRRRRGRPLGGLPGRRLVPRAGVARPRGRAGHAAAQARTPRGPAEPWRDDRSRAGHTRARRIWSQRAGDGWTARDQPAHG